MDSFPLHIQEEELTFDLEKKILKDFLEYSSETLGHNGDLHSFAVVCRDEQQNVLGLVAARSCYQGLYVRYLIVNRENRRRGLGTALIKRALEKGKALGCVFVHLETMSFQALGFYEKLGFQLDFTRSGFQDGILLHYLSKRL